ncbi:LysE family translocator [Burkholderia gladioli]|uniref:LysE family translocator n=1 Tax=Burkholderia gladioli TaxID=28095 RepID=UPI00163F6B26|nr:LysE family translocator [Burkholderia gladioli]
MLDLSTLGTFIVIMLGLFLVPGPAVLLVLSRTAQGGRRAGVMTSIGVAIGDFVHTLAAAAGLSALLMTSALAFNAVKYVGAAYLFYLGWRAWRAPAADTRLPELAGVTPGRACLQAILTELLNPKTALFFIAFLPQFVHPERGHAFAQFIELGLLFAVFGALYTSLLVLALRPLRHVLGRLPLLRRLQGKLIGGMLIGLGLKVAAQSR